MARVTLDAAGRWHVSFAATQPTINREPSGNAVGIDRGVATTVAFLPNRAKAKAGLNRSIHRSCWGLFAQRLQDKAQVSGVTVIKVNPAYSSVECRACGHKATENRESQAEFRCVTCGYTNHADTNAAQIVLARGLVALAPTPGQEGQDPQPGSARGNPEKSVARTTRTKAVA